MAEKNNEHAETSSPSKAPKPGSKDEAKENIIAIVLVLILIVGAGWWIYARLHPSAPAPGDAGRVSIPVGSSPVLGNESAPVTIVEFSDFECPFCGEFARNDFPRIKAEYVDTGKARIVFKQFPLGSIHTKAEKAAEAALCANDQGKFWEYHDLLFENQEKLDIADLEQYAIQAGLNATTFNSCLESGDRATDVALEKQLGERVGVSGTPTFYFNGRQVVGVLSTEEFGRQIAQG